MPYYAGRVKCIYIDPPYNTGNENWVYNDAVNSPEMRKTLARLPEPPSPPTPLPEGEGRILRVIYGEGCRLGAARLKREGIVFKQIPYGIKVS